MNNAFQSLPTTRREFLTWGSKGIGLLAFSQFAPSFLVQSTLAATPSPEKDRSILVLVQLAGGNDGLNTVIPYEDPEYYRLRPTIGIKKQEAIRLDDTLGLHPSLAALHGLMQDGSAGIIQNVGYPNPNHSHFRSSEIWETGSESNQFMPTGWIGRFLDNDCGGAPGTAGTGGDPVAVHVTNELPQSFQADKPHSTFGLRGGGNRNNKENLAFLEKLVKEDDHQANANASFLRATMMDALVTEQRVQKVIGSYRAESAYPGNNFAQSLRNVAALISSGMSTRVYFVSLGGFDTHSNQTNNHANLLKTLSEGLAAFQKDLVARKLDSQVLTMTFSEFGRRPNENESRGTDHGTAAPLFVMGSQIKGSLHGTPPSLALQKNKDLEFSTDFRQVYATVLDKWFSCPTDQVLGKTYAPLPFI
ncbi:DUF1501 domain-containing protein [Rariglobus hedericola]|uniref:DUF1501 domain-containing protein n=1 Tax=Rariglobus hedericola TaxID=2597822 RepID=A0A556QQ17_9BACT|nr:DUF1501 domain-containing protein [Rariglobus hedericola]TSJ78709.1 DUF1501 domain-containing protein [Rariglobus hedericola]